MYATRNAGHHRRLLVEDASGELANADFSLFRAAGFDVDFCGGECQGGHDADAMLFNLDSPREQDHRALRAMRSRYPETPVVVRLPRSARGKGFSHGCRTIAVPMSVDGQARTLWAAMNSRRRAV